MHITSPAFEHMKAIPEKYSCESDNPVSPPLQFHDVPLEARSLVLIVDDPDVPAEELESRIFDHWVMFNIDPKTTEILEDSFVGVMGANTHGENKYAPMCPPKKYEPQEHRYMFKLYALDSELDLPEGTTKNDVMSAMTEHVIDRAELIGVYQMK